jgi:hypothetical protein
MEAKRITQRIDRTNIRLFEMIRKIDKPLAKLTKRKEEKNQINTIIDERRNIMTDIMEIQRSFYEAQYYPDIKIGQGHTHTHTHTQRTLQTNFLEHRCKNPK